jgi:hypothetical protein
MQISTAIYNKSESVGSILASLCQFTLADIQLTPLLWKVVAYGNLTFSSTPKKPGRCKHRKKITRQNSPRVVVGSSQQQQ